MSSHASRHGTPAASLFLIRLSLLMGVLLFGGVTWFLRSQADPVPARAPDPTLEWIILGAWIVATAGIIFVSGKYRAAELRARRVTYAIVGWALGEMAAMSGGVHYFITGSPRRFGLGLIIFGMALLLFPIPRDEPEPTRRRR